MPLPAPPTFMRFL